MRILGIDPGSRLTGYGCIDQVAGQLVHVAHGTLRLSNTSGRAVIPLEQRLLLIYEGLSEVIKEFRPRVLAIEKVFFAKNAVSALKLGQARGAAILTGMIHGVEIVEYSATEVKQSVVGHGQADKEQVAKMIELLLGKRDFETFDASDGLALAICHAHHIRGAVSGQRAIPKKSKRMSLAESLGITLEQVGNRKRIDITSRDS
ncbi:MAG: crossover junction endodeoxyribonuclease RuvC [Bdellovibrionales bacterium RIFOXYC1_FULL_54_43]|nr:MAG: crossover junction endodeoxyribonuclease RuvC [Bdellovibrionales bacterium RIFOXYC1_FULL_54_43]OFZ83215.1 MAG: crossover junction endodeoxyribonuclease RuvC [Bdellovibrionales bacterium RIFOXYD1_FULL_55_31]